MRITRKLLTEVINDPEKRKEFADHLDALAAKGQLQPEIVEEVKRSLEGNNRVHFLEGMMACVLQRIKQSNNEPTL